MTLTENIIIGFASGFSSVIGSFLATTIILSNLKKRDNKGRTGLKKLYGSWSDLWEDD